MKTKKRLSPYIDGELSGRAVRRVEKHLRLCSLCRRELGAQAAARNALRGVGREVRGKLQAGSIWPLVRSELVREGKAASRFRARNRKRFWSRRKAWAGAVLAVVAAFFLIFLPPLIRRPAQIYSSIASIESPEHSVLIYQDGQVVLIWLTEEKI